MNTRQARQPHAPIASLWQHTGVTAPVRQRLQVDVRCDTVIIGAGFTGLSAAHELYKAGVSTVVLEANRVGWGASGRNGGVVSPKFRTAFPDIAAKYGVDTARRMNEIAHRAVEAVVEQVEEHNISDAHFETGGYLRCAHNKRKLSQMLTEAEWLKENFGDTTARAFSAEDVFEETGSRGFVGGLLHTDAGSIHPLNYVRGLAAGLDNKSVPIYEETPALRFGFTADGVLVETQEGSVRAKQLIIGTNAYSSITDATDRLKRTLIPFRSAIIATSPLPADLDSRLLVHGRSYGETRRMMRWFRKVDGRFVFGGRGAFGKEDSESAFRALQHAMVTLFPELHGVPVEFKWSGHVAMTLNSLPHVGRLNEHTCFAMGYNGTGVAMSSLLGRYAARFSLGETLDVALLDARNLRAVPFYPFRELGVRLTAGWYQLLDALGA